jgi:glycosyltransferase involved in cell wall biosynthesis
MAQVDVLVVSAANTTGWRAASEGLAGSIERAGARLRLAAAPPSPRVRTFALTDLVEARDARRAALEGIERHDPRAIVYCGITAALLWPRPGAIFLDSLAAENRPGRHGVWQRPVERRRLAQTPLVLAMSPRALDPLAGPHPETVIVPVPVDAVPVNADRVDGGAREIAAVAYAADPQKRRLSFVLDAWSRARRDGETLVVAGIELADVPEGVESAGRLAPAEFRALLGRSRTFVAAARREDYGIAALEALACGCQLVTTPSPGPFPALELARTLDSRLVSDDLASAIRTALDDPRPGYAEQAAELLEPFTPEAVDRTVAREVLPRLLGRP